MGKCRFLESHWFVWVTQSNHIPMEVNLDQKEGWVEMQVIRFFSSICVKKICITAKRHKEH